MYDKSGEVNNLKENGNSSFKQGKYEEAILYYSRAIQIDKKNHSLYSNRSLAFLKMYQFFSAMEDAKETIKLKPDWAKGYFRKAEVEFNTFNFKEAMLSYTHALMLQPNESMIEEGIKKTMAAMRKDEASDIQVSWIGAAIGIFIGASIVVCDQILTHTPTIVDPICMVLFTFAIAVLGYGAARSFRYYIKQQRAALLEPPIDLLKEQGTKNESVKEEARVYRTRTTKAKTRLRLKKGKM